MGFLGEPLCTDCGSGVSVCLCPGLDLGPVQTPQVPMPHVKVGHLRQHRTHKETLVWFREVAERSNDFANKYYWWACIYAMGEKP